MNKIIKNSDGSIFYTTGNVVLTKKGISSETIEVGEFDIERIKNDNEYVNELLNSSKIRGKEKHGT